MAFLGSSRAAGRLMVLLQMALFVIVSALIMNSSLCLAAAGQDDIAGSGSRCIGQKCSGGTHCCRGVPLVGDRP
uniref:Uncharacterized protein n=1 Tax=Triticum urartu TaxID=4572 RepID=A0A8R7P8T0_TRIUA